MEKKDLRIVYMGTPEFAVESLKRLVEGGYNVVAVITMPDKPMGRHGSVLQASPVKQYAVSQGLKVLQPEKLKDEAFVEELRALNADLQIVVAFRMLPEVVWNMPPMGTFNLHASLLPQYRGAAPINWAVMNGDTETGITTFFLKHEIDTGEVIQQVKVPIADTDNVEIVYDKLMMLGGDLVLETVDAILAGTVKSIPQEEMFASETELRPAPKIFKETCRIDWNKGVFQSPGVVFLVDGDQHIGHRGQQPLSRIEQQPVQQRCALEEMEAVGSINHFGSLFPGRQSCQTGNHGTHRSMTVNDIVISLVDDLLQHFIGLNVSEFPGHPFKGNIIIGIAVRNLAVSRIFVVVFGGYRCFPAHFLKHFQVRNMKLHHMGFDDCGYKKHLFLLHGFFPPGNIFCKKWT